MQDLIFDYFIGYGGSWGGGSSHHSHGGYGKYDFENFIAINAITIAVVLHNVCILNISREQIIVNIL